MRNELQHFPNLDKMVKNDGFKDKFENNIYIGHLQKLYDEFDKRFADLKILQQVAEFISNLITDI